MHFLVLVFSIGAGVAVVYLKNQINPVFESLDALRVWLPQGSQILGGVSHLQIEGAAASELNTTRTFVTACALLVTCGAGAIWVEVSGLGLRQISGLG